MTDVNVVNLSIYDLSTYLASGYNRIRVYTASAADATFNELTASATRLVLTSGTEYYQYLDTNGGDSSLYKFKISKSSGSGVTGFITGPFYANTTDLTEALRYDIEDITVPYRYTIKELRRFIMMALSQLQLTGYYRQFTSDKDGLISPVSLEDDVAIILLQANMQVNKSQLTRAADTAMSFSDSRGNINVRTHAALIDNLKFLKSERDALIAAANRNKVLPKRVVMQIPLLENPSTATWVLTSNG